MPACLTSDKDRSRASSKRLCKAQLTVSEQAQGKLEQTLGATVPHSPREFAKETSNWITVELLGLLNARNAMSNGQLKSLTIRASSITPQMLAGVLLLKRTGKISGPVAKMVLEVMFETRKEAEEIVEDKGLIQVSDEGDACKRSLMRYWKRVRHRWRSSKRVSSKCLDSW